MQMNEPLPPKCPEHRASMEVIRRQAVLASTLNTSGVLDFLPVMVVLLNEQRQIVLANGSMARLLKRPAAALLGLRLGEALGCDHRHAAPTGCGTTAFCCHCGAAKAIVSGLSGRHDVQECRITRDSTDMMTAVNYQFYSMPVSLAGERFVFASMLDISFERRVQLIERLFYHDVLDTSAGIHGLCEMLASQVSVDLRDDTEVLLGASSRLVDQIFAQRQFAAAESREIELQPVKLGTRSLLLDLQEFYRRQGVAAGKLLRLDPESEDLYFSTDKSLLYRVLSNLIRNALEASSEGETVTISCARAPGGILYRVHNPAVMPQAVRLQLFTRFFSTKGPGRGLGSYSARLFTEEYLDGRLSVRSEPGFGTEFTIVLPYSLRVPAADAAAPPAAPLTPAGNER
ncbi:PAS domain-containing sensor histidine kinase [Humidesulfovibrio sp.]